MEVVKAAAHVVRLLEIAHELGYGKERDEYTKESELLLRRALMPVFREGILATWEKP